MRPDRPRGERRPGRRHGGHSNKTHATALAIVPPEAAWEPIQAIRRAHDRKIDRWMPHINVLYPFRPQSEFDFLSLDLLAACARVEPFEAVLERFGAFDHGAERYSLYLTAEPQRSLGWLEELVWRKAKDCDDTRSFEGGFQPHLTVGQVNGLAERDRLLAELQAGWQPLAFPVGDVCLLARGEPPEDVFRIDRRIPLGAG